MGSCCYNIKMLVNVPHGELGSNVEAKMNAFLVVLSSPISHVGFVSTMDVTFQ